MDNLEFFILFTYNNNNNNIKSYQIIYYNLIFYEVLIKIAEKNSIKNGQSKQFEINKKKIVIFNINETYYALDSLCVHQDRSLVHGKVTNNVIECPSHSWHYDIKTGKLLDYLKDIKLSTYDVKNTKNGIYIDV